MKSENQGTMQGVGLLRGASQELMPLLRLKGEKQVVKGKGSTD